MGEEGSKAWLRENRALGRAYIPVLVPDIVAKSNSIQLLSACVVSVSARAPHASDFCFQKVPFIPLLQPPSLPFYFFPELIFLLLHPIPHGPTPLEKS